ncbi:uncharacterized protein LOC111806930 isoform X4 [Cucurbita pepo subsp. pepo]|uniref:uncharacterized protein LOC111806930 isoform X4 n=1 Tax=Cucurbita pepo subsp. pepo TaxID=3664 RepID=UPI000C9D49CC|nr:uncharacterized protein LOC111806930 isoform X4 [Cucurbita pepo subsp. pepo]
MATTDVLKRHENRFTFSSLSDPLKGDMDSRDMSIEKKIEFLESLTGKVTNRKTRRWLNDRLLMELVPRLNAEEIRGLFAPPPWGDDVRPTTFSMTNAGDWDKFRSIDMDKEAKFIGVLENSSIKRKGHIDADKVAFLNAWRRIECQTREALRRSFLPELVEAFEFYNLDSVTVPELKNGSSTKMTRVTRKKKALVEIPNITLTHFLKMSKEGTW